MDDRELPVTTPPAAAKKVYVPPVVTDLGDAVANTLGDDEKNTEEGNGFFFVWITGNCNNNHTR